MYNYDAGSEERREMVKFSSQWSTLASCPPFFEWLVGEAVLGLSLGPPACLPLAPALIWLQSLEKRIPSPSSSHCFLLPSSTIQKPRSGCGQGGKASPDLGWAFARGVAASLKLLTDQPENIYDFIKIGTVLCTQVSRS